MTSLADLAAGQSEFTALLGRAEIRALLQIFPGNATPARHLRRCRALLDALASLARGLYGRGPDQVVALVRDRIAPLADAATRPVLRAQLGQLADHQVRCLIASFCRAADHGEGEYALALCADAASDPRWARIAFGAGIRLGRAPVSAWAQARLPPAGRRAGPPLDADGHWVVQRAVPALDLDLDPAWSADRIRALVDLGYDPAARASAARVSALGAHALGALLDCLQTPDLLLVHDADGDQMTAIARAADCGDVDGLRTMLAFLARFDRARVGVPAVLSVEIRGMTPLALAAYRGHTEAARLLLEFIPGELRPHALGQCDFRGRGAIHWAAYNCHEDVLRLLLVMGAGGSRQVQQGLVSAADHVHGGHRPYQYPHLPPHIRRVFDEAQYDCPIPR